jgi:hypothetical protein
MERIAEALNVSQATISGDLGNLSTPDKSKPAKTASNPKGAGRPKSSSGGRRPSSLFTKAGGLWRETAGAWAF